MKTAAKVFLIIGMILGFYLIFPIVLGSITIRKINEAKSSEELTKWGIISIFLVSTLGGIFVLCIKDEDLLSDNNSDNFEEVVDENVIYDNPSQRLIELKELKDEGIIDENTYQEKRKKYLEEL